MALLRMVLAASALLSNEIEQMSQSAYVKPNVLNCSSILKRFNMFDCIERINSVFHQQENGDIILQSIVYWIQY